MSGWDLVLALLGLVGAFAGLLGLLLILDWLFAEPEVEVECVMHPDQWGWHCSSHNVRARGHDQCPGRNRLDVSL